MGTEEDPGPWWIIPTSGHRAYPFKTWPIESEVFFSTSPPIPDDWPDHYQAKDEPMVTFDIGEILAGLMKPIGKFKRRA
jgi:hypothetical protein